MNKEIILRYKKNPILTKSDIPYPVETVHNAGVAKWNGKYLMLFRSQQPEDPWEITGYVPNVVFSCATIPEPDGSVKIYWGGADRVMCVGTARVKDLVALCLKESRDLHT